MSDDEIERIRARLARVQSTGLSYDCPSGHCDELDDDEPRCGSPDCEWRDEVSDIATLLAALDASRREAERLRGQLTAMHRRAQRAEGIADRVAADQRASRNRRAPS